MMKTENLVLRGRAKAAGEDTPQVSVELPENFSEATEVWGEEVSERVFANAVRELALRFAKGQLATGLAPEQIQSKIEHWAPGQRAGRKAQPKLSKVFRSVANLSDEERAELVRQLQSGLAA